MLVIVILLFCLFFFKRVGKYHTTVSISSPSLVKESKSKNHRPCIYIHVCYFCSSSVVQLLICSVANFAQLFGYLFSCWLLDAFFFRIYIQMCMNIDFFIAIVAVTQ